MSIARWRTVSITIGIASLVGGGATAYAWPSGSARAATPVVSSVSAHDVSAPVTAGKAARLRIAAEDAVGWIAAITARLEDKVAAFGSPATITPREADHLRDKVRFVGFLQGKAGELAAAGTTGAAALQTRLAALKSKLSSILANATVVKPFVDAATTSTDGTATDFGAFGPDGHHCDGHHDWGGWHSATNAGRGFAPYDGRHHVDSHEHRYGDFHR